MTNSPLVPSLLTTILLASAATASELDLPAKRKVTAESAVLRSGPGESFYATGRLRRGDVVEIYRQDAGGWFAVRPSTRSFSWVDARQLRETGDRRVARVVGSDVVAWVGSDVEEVGDYKWQVKLKPGEAVRVLGQDRFAMFTGDPPRDYRRIAPPAGEFRWVHQRDVQPLGKASVTGIKSEVELAQFRIDLPGADTAPPLLEVDTPDTGDPPRDGESKHADRCRLLPICDDSRRPPRFRLGRRPLVRLHGGRRRPEAEREPR